MKMPKTGKGPAGTAGQASVGNQSQSKGATAGPTIMKQGGTSAQPPKATAVKGGMRYKNGTKC